MPADISAGLLPSLSLPPGHPHILCGRLVLAGDQYQVGLTDCTEKPCGDDVAYGYRREAIMAELLFGEIKKFNTVEFLLLEGGTESFRGGRSGMIQDFWVKGGDLYHPETKFSLWTKSKRGLKTVVLDICYVEGDRPPTKKEVNQAIKIFRKELSRRGWLFKKAKRGRDLMGCAERDWRSAQW